MKRSKIDEMKGGWFVGNFDPSILKTPDFEVGFKVFEKDEVHEAHYHKIATEYNYLVSGSILIDDQKITAGDIFTFEPGEVADLLFLERCEIVVVKVPSVKNDKYII
jgi:quercetin dioxygenase-like cupin family protein